MTPTSHPKSPRPRRERRIVVRSIRRDPIDTKAYAKALVDTILREVDESIAVNKAVRSPRPKK